MPSGQYYKIEIDDGTSPIWLTSTLAESGIPCFLSVPGANNLLTGIAGSVIETVGGRVVQPTAYQKDKDFEIKVSIMPSALWEELVALRETLLTADDSVQIVGTGQPGNFDVMAKPRPDEMFSYESFEPGWIYEVSMKFYTV